MSSVRCRLLCKIKTLHCANIELDVDIKQLNGLVSFIEQCRKNRFDSALVDAKAIADEMNVEARFKVKRLRRKNTLFDYEAKDEPKDDPEERFRTEYFLRVVDQCLASLKSCFQQFESYNSNFGFHFNSQTMSSMNNNE